MVKHTQKSVLYYFVGLALKGLIMIACRVQTWKKNIFSKYEKFGYSFIKNDITYTYSPIIYKKPIILSLFEIVNF